MKKYLAIILGVFFVLAFAVSSYAEVALNGEITHWNWYRDNMSDGTAISGNTPIATSNQAFSLTRVRLGADIKVSDNVKGMLEMETTGGPENDVYTWGGTNTKHDAMNLRQAWLQYTGSGLLGIPAGIKMGHMPLILGLGKFLNNTRYGDDAIVLFADPNKQLHIGLLTFKASEGGVTTYTCVNNTTGVITPLLTSCPAGSTAIGSTTTGGISDNSDDVDVYGALVTYKIDDKTNFGINYTRVNDSDSSLTLRQFQNLMLHGATDVSGLKIKAEIDYQFGKLDAAGTKAAGYLLFAELGYKVDPVGIRASYANGSGDKSGTTDKDEDFINFLGPDENVAWIYEYQIMSASGGDNTSGLTNTTMLNVGLDYSPMKDLGLALDGYLLRANKVAAGSKKVGTEVDLKAKYNVAKGLTWTVLAGYFSPGEYYGAGKKSATAARSELTLSF